MGHSADACLLSITALSTPAIVLGLMLFRRRAARRLALIGLSALAVATVGYALHCTQDAALFFTLWYGLAFGICTIAGAGAGRRLLR